MTVLGKVQFTKFLLVPTLLVGVFMSAAAAQSGKIENVAEQAASVTEFEVNGLKVLLKKRAAAPTVAVGLFVRGGARNIDPTSAGIESLMLNTAIQAGKKFPRQVLRRELARTGSNIAAGSDEDYSQVSLASTRQNFDRIWEIFTDVLLNPAFAPDDLERIKQQILTGLRESEISPDGALDALEGRIVFAGHPYANEVAGTIASIGSFTSEDLAKYHKRTMTTSQLLLVVVGDLDVNDLKNRVAATFGRLPRGDYQEKPLPSVAMSKPTIDIVTRNIPTNYVKGVFAAPSLSSPDYYSMRVAMTILHEMVTREVRYKRLLSYAPSADLGDDAANTASIYVTAVDANQAVSVMLDQIKELKARPIDDDQLAGMAGQFLTSYYVQQETNGAQVQELARYELTGGGWRNSFEFLNKIREVKPQDIQAVSEKYMKNIRFVVIGDPQAINKNIFLGAE